MHWNEHYNLRDKHAFLGASKFSWLRYDEEKLKDVFLNLEAKERGTKLHNLAKEHIELRMAMPHNNKTFNKYVNDCIKNNMQPEQILYYSSYAFGTADAINYDESKKKLQIYDLKTGMTPAHMEQLQIYAALFCLEYKVDPFAIEYDLRIYQNDEVIYGDIFSDDIQDIMNIICNFSSIIETMEDELS